MKRSDLQYQGWGLVGWADAEELLVDGPDGCTLEVYGYNIGDYWNGDEFLGPDLHGIVPVYQCADGTQFPADARRYPHFG